MEALLGHHVFYEVLREAGGTGEVPRTIERMAQGRVGDDWPAAFTAMLAYAGDKGWLTDDGAGIQAHCKWQ